MSRQQQQEVEEQSCRAASTTLASEAHNILIPLILFTGTLTLGWPSNISQRCIFDIYLAQRSFSGLVHSYTDGTKLLCKFEMRNLDEFLSPSITVQYRHRVLIPRCVNDWS